MKPPVSICSMLPLCLFVILFAFTTANAQSKSSRRQQLQSNRTLQTQPQSQLENPSRSSRKVYRITRASFQDSSQSESDLPDPLSATESISPAIDSQSQETPIVEEISSEALISEALPTCASGQNSLDQLFAPLPAAPLGNLQYPQSRDESLRAPANLAREVFAQFPAVPADIKTSTENSMNYAWQGRDVLWLAPNAVHQPLYFEDIAVERYGQRTLFFQPAVSAVNFAYDAAVLPVRAIIDPPKSLLPTQRHFRAGASVCPHDYGWLGN
jgi:hypothetical protein